jgi:hypothetical protein
VGRSLSDLSSSIASGFIGRTVRSVENGRERIYTVRDVRIFQDCSAQILDFDRFTDSGNGRQSWTEEYNQQFSLAAVQASITSSNDISRVVITGASPRVIRLERSSSIQGSRTEFPAFVQFDLPRDAETDRAFAALRLAIQQCNSGAGASNPRLR